NLAFSLPVAGKLGSPGFSFGGAVMAALKNALVNLVAGPLGAIGKLFSRGEAVEEIKIDPVEFQPGGASVTAEGDGHLQRLADFLRAAPNATLTLRPVVSDADLASLRTGELTARIQRVQREGHVVAFAEAAARVFWEAHPDRPLPK